MLKHYCKVVAKILYTDYAYSKFRLLFDYTRLLFQSVLFHKLKTQKRTSHFTGRLLGFTITFDNYPQLLDLVEEIFVYESYAFESRTNKPFIIDCGSNIGLSILYFKKRFPSSTIIGFEPDLDNFNILTENILRNNLQNISIHNVALGDKPETVLFYKDQENKSSLATSVFRTSSSASTLNVQVQKLSDFVTQSVDLIKIDVEGSEVAILNDLITSDKLKYIKRMIVEYHPHITNIPLQVFKRSIIHQKIDCVVKNTGLRANPKSILLSCKNPMLTD